MSKYVRNIAKLKRRAEKRGERDAAIFLIQEFVNHADEFDSSSIPASDKLVVRFIVRAMREILANRNPKAALCLDAEGRPEVGIERDLSLAVQVYEQHKEVGSVNWAVDRVARHTKTPRPTVLGASKRFGGLKGIASLLAGERIKRKVKQTR